MRPFAVIVPHFGADSLLDECLRSLERYSAWIGAVHVIDNNRCNCGFTKACNLGLMAELATPRGQHFLLLNNDCVPVEAPFAPLYLRLRQPGVGIVTPMNVLYEDRDRITWGGGLQVLPGVHKSGSVRLGNWSTPTRERWATFSVVALRRGMVRRLGLLDERFVNVCSDADYSYRARAAGWSVSYEPRSVWAHRWLASRQPDAAQARRHRADQLAFVETHVVGELFQWGLEMPLGVPSE